MIKKTNLLNEIKAQFGKGEVTENTITFKEVDLKIQIIQLESTAQLMRADFILLFTKLDHEINESMLAIGNNENHTTQKLAEQFIALFLTPIFNAIEKNNTKDLIQHTIYNDNCNFHPHASEVIITGEVDGDQSARVYPDGLYAVIKEELMEYIGFHKVYVVHMLISTTFVETQVIVKVNGEKIEKLSRILTKEANKLDVKSVFYSEQQTLVLWQDGEVIPPFDYAVINDICQNLAMPLFEKATKEEYDSIYDKILAKVKSCKIADENLARDIFLLVPEILCEIIFEGSTDFEDKVTLVNGDKLIEVRTCQLRLYEYIKRSISDYLIVVDPERDAILNAYGFSARYNCIEKALINQTDLSRIANISFALQINDDYKIY